LGSCGKRDGTAIFADRPIKRAQEEEKKDLRYRGIGGIFLLGNDWESNRVSRWRHKKGASGGGGGILKGVSRG